MLKKFTIALGIMLAAQFSAQSAMAENEGVNMFFAPGFFWFDDNDIDDTETINAGIGYRFNKHWGVEVAYIDLRDTRTSISFPNGKLEGEGYHVDALYFFNESNGFLPYIALGAGEVDFDVTGPSVSLSGDETFTNLGAGVKKYITPHLALRGDVRAVKFNDESDINAHVMFGIDYFFGDRGAKPVAVAAAPMDSDGDGVADANDSCPNTPAGVAVDSKGCPVDSDGDGVPDYKDQCPNTPAGARVDKKGCQYVITETATVELEVLFDLNKAEVKPEFFPEIKRVAEFMTLFPKTSARIEGHTDSMGEADYNKGLSQRRAEAVRDVLINEHKIDASRLEAIGYGEDKPRASNDTREGRMSNRRVVSIIATEVEKKLQ